LHLQLFCEFEWQKNREIKRWEKIYLFLKFLKFFEILGTLLPLQKEVMWYYCAVTGESKKIVFTSRATEKITSGVATSDFWSPHK
jgi:hypothetical protein